MGAASKAGGGGSTARIPEGREGRERRSGRGLEARSTAAGPDPGGRVRRKRRWWWPGGMEASALVSCDRNSAGSGRGGDRGGGVSVLPLQEVGVRVGREALGAACGRPDTYLRVPGSSPRTRPSASPPPPTLHVAPRLLLRGRRRPEPGWARARLPAPAPRRLASRLGEHRAALSSPAPLGGERRQRQLPHVSPGCPVSQQFPPGPQRRLRRSCHRLSHIPGLQRSRRRRRRRAATTTLALLLPAPLVPLTPPACLGPARSGETVSEAAVRPPQPPAHNPPRGSAGAGGRGPDRG